MPISRAQNAYNQTVATTKHAKNAARNVQSNIEALNATYPLLDADESLVAELDKIRADVAAAMALLNAAEHASAEMALRHIKANPERVRPDYEWTVRQGHGTVRMRDKRD